MPGRSRAPWAKPRPDLGPDTRLGTWCWTWHGWATWWERGPAVASLPEHDRITAHASMAGAWATRGGTSETWPLLWAVCGARVIPGGKLNLRYARRCPACLARVGPDWVGRKMPRSCLGPELARLRHRKQAQARRRRLRVERREEKRRAIALKAQVRPADKF